MFVGVTLGITLGDWEGPELGSRLGLGDGALDGGKLGSLDGTSLAYPSSLRSVGLTILSSILFNSRVKRRNRLP